ncbi:MAG: HD domain-containing protein [Thaumarchaeota archaeon]|nr:HD domain-containing protein [Nitrososphaerota archaeon]
MLEDFFEQAIGLKSIHRKGWTTKVGIKEPESVADHSYSMTVMSLVLAELQTLDVQKVATMSLIHDLAESLVGDYTPDEISLKQKMNLENNAMKEILSDLPATLAKKYEKIWNEYQSAKTKEAKLVHEIDKLEMAFQARKYFEEGYDKSKIVEFLKTADKEIKNEYLRKILNKIIRNDLLTNTNV